MASANVQESGSNANSNATRRDHYVYSEDSIFTQKQHANRTATRQAAFFLPHLQPGMKLLDCGSGSGSITVGLAQVVAPGEVTGIDISEAEVARAQRKAADEGIHNLHFEVGNAYHLAFPADSFDALFSHNMLEHVGEPHKALQEMWRVLKPGGVIGLRDTDMGGVIFNAADEVVGQYPFLHEAIWERAGGYPRLARRLRGLLHEAGFVDVVASASYEAYGDLEALRSVTEVLASRCSEPDFVRQVTAHGLADAESLGALKAALHAWAEQPDAFLAIAHGEAVGRKGETAA